MPFFRQRVAEITDAAANDCPIKTRTRAAALTVEIDRLLMGSKRLRNSHESMIQHRTLLTAAIVLILGTFDAQAFAQQGYEFGVRFQPLNFRPQTFGGFSFRGQTFQTVRNQPIQFRTINFPALNSPPIRLDRRDQEQQSTSAASAAADANHFSASSGRLDSSARQIETASPVGATWLRPPLSPAAGARRTPSSSRQLLAAQRNPFAPVKAGIHTQLPSHDGSPVSRLAGRTDNRSARFAGAGSRDSRRFSIATQNRSAIRLSADEFTKRSYR